MTNSFAKSVKTTLLLIAFLFALAALGTKLPNTGRIEFVHELINHARIQRVTQPREGGYYQILMRPAKGQGLLKHTPIELLTLSKQIRTATQTGEIYQFNSFRIYEGKRNLNFPNSVEGPIRTNSFGLFDYEHPLQKSAGVRRIAIVGDSVIKGNGVDLDQRFSTQLQNLLNTDDKEHFEIINFAQPGYGVAQLFDVTMEQIPAFHPDVYIWALTDRNAGPLWAENIIQLVQDGHDLKYDVLKKTIQQAGITQTDSTELMRWKLEPYKQALMRELFLRTNSRAEQDQAKLVVFFVPSAQDQNVLDNSFRSFRECLQGTGIPVVDASQTFKGTDLDHLRLSWHDLHPSTEGHKLIAENLYNRLYENPDAWMAVTGNPSKNVLGTH